MTRKGDVLIRSTSGRWASRLSLGVTRFLTACLAQRRPDALVTDQVQAQAPDERIEVAINELSVSPAGIGTLNADWQVVPRNPRLPGYRGRRRFTVNGAGATDQDVVTLMSKLLLQLANSIDLPRRR